MTGTDGATADLVLNDAEQHDPRPIGGAHPFSPRTPTKHIIHHPKTSGFAGNAKAAQKEGKLDWADIDEEERAKNGQAAGSAGPRGGQVVRETDETRLRWREKQIQLGKRTLGYLRYTDLVPREQRRKKLRQSYHPDTPEKYQICSKRSFQGQITKWRKLLHWWDGPEEEKGDTLVARGSSDEPASSSHKKSQAQLVQADCADEFEELSLSSRASVSPMSCWSVPPPCGPWVWYGHPAGWGMYSPPYPPYPWMMTPPATACPTSQWFQNTSPFPSPPNQWSWSSPEPRNFIFDSSHWPIMGDSNSGAGDPQANKFSMGSANWGPGDGLKHSKRRHKNKGPSKCKANGKNAKEPPERRRSMEPTVEPMGSDGTDARKTITSAGKGNGWSENMTRCYEESQLQGKENGEQGAVNDGRREGGTLEQHRLQVQGAKTCNRGGGGLFDGGSTNKNRGLLENRFAAAVPERGLAMQDVTNSQHDQRR